MVRRWRRWVNFVRLGASVEAVTADKLARQRSRMHRVAVSRHESHAVVRAVEDDFVVAHACAADDGAIMLVVEDAEAPHATPQLVGILSRPKRDAHPVAEVKAGEGESSHAVRAKARKAAKQQGSKEAGQQGNRAASPPTKPGSSKGSKQQSHPTSADERHSESWPFPYTARPHLCGANVRISASVIV